MYTIITKRNNMFYEAARYSSATRALKAWRRIIGDRSFYGKPNMAFINVRVRGGEGCALLRNGTVLHTYRLH